MPTAPYYDRDGVTVYAGDCVEVMAGMEPDSVDAVVCDPPYELNFMAKSWDASGVAFDPETWKAALRVLKPGGHLLAFGGTRTAHRMTVAIEDAGFEIRDSVIWVYGSGFPKSLNVSKAIDKAAGAEGDYGEPKSAAHAGWIKRGRMRGEDGHGGWRRPWIGDADAVDRNAREYLPGAPEAQQWQGWGTALKPAHEPVTVARKPLSAGTVAANVLQWGTGALNIEATRIGMGEEYDPTKVQRQQSAGAGAVGGAFGAGALRGREIAKYKPGGRWPANVVLDVEAGAELDRQTGTSTSSYRPPSSRDRNNGIGLGADDERGGLSNAPDNYGDSGGASRFFYCAKASKADRPELYDADGKKLPGHPTVKPLSLMRWLVRLVTPPGGTVLDPFAGSGSTLVAASIEGFSCVGIEREADYLAIIAARLSEPVAPVLDLGGGS